MKNQFKTHSRRQSILCYQNSNQADHFEFVASVHILAECAKEGFVKDSEKISLSSVCRNIIKTMQFYLEVIEAIREF